MAKQYLPRGAVLAVFNHYCIGIVDPINNQISVGIEGRKAFMKEAMKRDNYLPEALQETIDNSRGKMSIRKYLFSHEHFRELYRTIVPKQQREKPVSKQQVLTH